jgi:hypothetical protein
MKAVKITNPIWLGEIAPRVKDFIDRIIKMRGYTYETLYTYLSNTIQFGGNNAEFWVVMDNGKPVAFASWYIKPLPWSGAVHFDTIYKWSGGNDVIKALVDEFIAFGQKNKAPVLTAGSYNKAVIKLLERECDKRGYSCSDTGCKTLLMEKKDA